MPPVLLLSDGVVAVAVVVVVGVVVAVAAAAALFSLCPPLTGPQFRYSASLLTLPFDLSQARVGGDKK